MREGVSSSPEGGYEEDWHELYELHGHLRHNAKGSVTRDGDA